MCIEPVFLGPTLTTQEAGSIPGHQLLLFPIGEAYLMHMKGAIHQLLTEK